MKSSKRLIKWVPLGIFGSHVRVLSRTFSSYEVKYMKNVEESSLGGVFMGFIHRLNVTLKPY